MHYYFHHIGDFIKSTSRLSDSQVMAYLRIMWMYYDKDGILEYDIEQISFEIGSDTKTTEMIIKTYFKVVDNFLAHDRCDKELSGYLKKSEGGKLGANRRWNNINNNSLPIANPMRTQCNPNANQEPITNNQQPIKNNTQKNEFFADINQQVVSDYLAVRKAKRAPKVSKTVYDGIERESKLAGITIEQALIVCVERNWVGFKAEWFKKEIKPMKGHGVITDEQFKQWLEPERQAING